MKGFLGSILLEKKKERWMIMQRQQITSYEQAVDYLMNIPKFTSKHTPEDTQKHLHKLGDPDQKLHIIHVAGTNGKGSVCAYIRNILEAAGYTTTVFTSPHLVDIRERFLIKGEEVSKEAFLQAFLEVYDSLDWEHLEYHPTFFEYLFFMAMLLFAQAGADYCILETGLGGRLDATNSVSEKELTVITRIGLDHVEYLGDTVEAIAGEKAGIMRPHVPCVCIDTEDATRSVFEEMAEKLQTPIYFLSQKDYTFVNFKNKSIDFSLQSEYYDYIRLTLHTHALYQMENASLAVLAIGVLDEGRTVLSEHIREGVANCVWQGRMEELLPRVFVDGAHNEDGIRAFLDSVKKDECQGKRSLLFSVVQDKDYTNMIQNILQEDLFDRIAIAHMKTGRAAELERLQAIFEKNGKKLSNCTYTLYENVETALGELMNTREPDETIYIAGSLYLVGEIKELLGRKGTL